MKSRYKLLAAAGIALLASGALLTACSNKSSDTGKSESQKSSLSTGDVKTTLSKVDNTKWKYNSDDKVYYQVGVSYAASPTDSEQQTLSIFVPASYMTATDNGDGTYTAELNTKAKVGNYTAANAPIVIPINTPGYSAMSALTDYTSSAKTYTDEGFIYVSAGLRGRDSGAPGGVTDAKAAIRYLRYNDGSIAGDTDRIFVFGMSGGGAQSAIIGSSGDSALYDDYLKEIGAVEGVSDAVAGVMAWCPITNLDTANEAYEWSMGSTRSDLSTEEQTISDGLAEAYASYINKLKLKDSDGQELTLKKTSDGIYQSGTYYDYLKETVEESLNTFLENTSFPYDASSASSGGPGGAAPSGEAPSGEAPSGSAPSGEAPSGQASTTETSSDDSAESSGSIESVDNIQRSGSSTSLDLSGTYNSIEDYISALNSESTWVKYDSKTKKATITSMADFVKYMKSATKGMAAFDALDKS
ncbi:subtype A tannase, partial [Streptococcus sp. DD11]|uniref:subtype A tannase n=1 Tax=Streptococcus sp. DD11 TaxID=1777879 RepID=UPI0010084578